MKLLVGLGNPGNQHRLNRHNIGFLFADLWAQANSLSLKYDKKMLGDLAKCNVQGNDVVVLKPNTYMNNSGDSIQPVMKFYKIKIEDVIVMHDELDIPPWSLRIKKGGGHGGHNGLRSIHPIGDSYIRFRLGIGRPPHPNMAVSNFVLGNFTETEQAGWEERREDVLEAIDLCLGGNVEQAMNTFNRKEGKNGA